jgi:arylsulfatase A-like enzyme
MHRVNIERMIIVRLSLLLFGVAIFIVVRPTKAAAEQPNILFIYTDDQSHRTVSCYDEAYSWVKTPNIDSLSKRGARFTHAYIGSWCAASRLSVLTGRQQHAIESFRATGEYPGNVYDPEQCQFFPKLLRQRGYFTAQIGKWHTGDDSGFGRDWDHQVVWNRIKFPKNSPNYYDNQLIVRDGSDPVLTKGYSTDNYTNWAIDFINGKTRDPQKPWMLWLCYGAVHGPFTPADRHENAYPDADIPEPSDIYGPRPGKPKYVRDVGFWEKNEVGIPVEKKVRDLPPVAMVDIPGKPLKDWVRQYQQGVLAIDEGVGRLIKVLETTGQLDNTVIVFTSDQGFAWGQHGFKNKVAPYDAAIRGPLIIVKPDSQPTVIRTPVTAVDLTATIMAQAETNPRWKMHGRDLTPLIKGVKNFTGDQTRMLLTHTARSYGKGTTVIPKPGDKALTHGPGVPWYAILCEGKFKYVRTLIEGEVEELYDVNNDPEELDNLALKPAFQGILASYRANAKAELQRTEAPFVGNLPAVKKVTKSDD